MPWNQHDELHPLTAPPSTHNDLLPINSAKNNPRVANKAHAFTSKYHCQREIGLFDVRFEPFGAESIEVSSIQKTGSKSFFWTDRKEDGGKGITYGDKIISRL